MDLNVNSVLDDVTSGGNSQPTADRVIAFCAKSKMAAVRHPELIFDNSGPPAKSSCRPNAAFRISYRSNTQFRRYRHSKI